MEARDPIIKALYRYTRALSVALDHRDRPTRLHSDRVGNLAAELGTHCGLAQRELGTLAIAAAFHDIGKIGIPDHILMKPSALAPEEWAAIQRHSEIGEEILLATELDGVGPAANLIRHHHEHFDGGGYPDGLAGESIPFGARIIGIVDSYDAMAVTRSYHRARSHAEIMSILHEESGAKHDPVLLGAFERMIAASRFRVA